MTDTTQKFIAAQRSIAAQRGGTPSPRTESQDEPSAPPFSIQLSPGQLRDRERAERAEFLNATSSASPFTRPRGSGR